MRKFMAYCLMSLFVLPTFDGTSAAEEELKKATSVPQATSPIFRNRVIFDEDVRWSLSKYNTDHILGRIKRAGFNVYVVNVWHGRGSFYPTEYAHTDTRVKKRIAAGDDPLEYLIQQAHKLNIEVHAWYTVVKREDEQYPQYYDDGTPAGAYNVHLPEFRHFFTSLLKDVVTRYDLDGINLDYIRTMGICESEWCREDYKKFSNRNSIFDTNAKSVSITAYDSIQAWQDNAVEMLVRQISQHTRSVNENIIISADGHPKPQGEKRPLDGRNLVKWENGKLIDIVYLMDYGKEIDFKTAMAVKHQLSRPENLVVLQSNYEKKGRAVFPRSKQEMESAIIKSRQNFPSDSIAFYLYNMLSEDQITLFQDQFNDDASSEKK